MRPELDKKLCEEFPVLFKDRNKSMQETAMYWGFQCGDGWYDLIHEACQKIVEADPEAVASTVKEKFGCLRIYLTGNEKAQDIAEWALQQSENICEGCGSTEGVTQTRGWIVTLCCKCMREYRRKHRQYGLKWRISEWLRILKMIIRHKSLDW